MLRLIPSLSELSLKVKELREGLSEKEQQLQETEREVIQHATACIVVQVYEV